MHSIRNPKSALMSAASWFPLIKWTLRGYSICKKDTTRWISGGQRHEAETEAGHCRKRRTIEGFQKYTKSK